MNYPTASSHMRRDIISILATGRPPRLNVILPPRPPTTLPPRGLIADKTTPTTSHRPDTLPMIGHVSSHMSLMLTKLATWNIDKQATYDVPIKVCLHGNIDILHCTEPVKHMIPETRATATLINEADKAGYTIYVTDHSHTYIRQASIHIRFVSQRSICNGRLYTFLFQGDDQ